MTSFVKRFAEKHPYWSMAANFAGDAAAFAPFGIKSYRNAKSYERVAEQVRNAIAMKEFSTPVSKEITVNFPIKPMKSTMSWGRAKTYAYYNQTGSPYENLMGEGFTIDRGAWSESDLGVKGKRFGEYLGGGGEQTVFQDTSNPNMVLKVYNDTYTKDISGLKDFNRNYPKGRNTIPFQEQIKLVGYVRHNLKGKTYLYPVYQ